MAIAASMRVEAITAGARVTMPTVLPIFTHIRIASRHIQAHTSAHLTRILLVSGIQDTALILVPLVTALGGVGKGISGDSPV